MGRVIALLAWMILGVHWIKPIPSTPGRWRWVPCDKYGRLRSQDEEER